MDLHDFTPQNIIRVIKSKKMRWVGHMARMGEMRNTYNISAEKLEGKKLLLIDLRLDGEDYKS
jgi:hypothetical protein